MRTLKVAVLLFGFLSSAALFAADAPVVFAVSVVPSPANKLKHTTEKYDDVLTVTGAKFSSKTCTGYGYPEGECQMKKDGARTVISAEIKDDKHGTNKYDLVVQGDKIAGTMKWSKIGEDDKPKTAEYTVTGSVKMMPLLFGEIACELLYATPAEIQDALNKQAVLRPDWADSRIGDILILMGVLDGMQVAQILAEQSRRKNIQTPSETLFPVYGDYDIVSKLGEGGIGSVFLARERMLKRLVVLKILRKDRREAKDICASFELEARLAGALNHSNLVACHNTGVAQGVRYLVMEYVQGQTLQDRIAALGRLAERDVLLLAREIAAGLAHAHARGILHRDVKPSNILLGDDGSVKLSDFGSALDMFKDEPVPSQIVGTPNYMPPEQVRADRLLDGRADLYSLGCTFYHALTGQLPHPGATAMLAMQAHLVNDPVPLRSLAPELSEQTARIVERLMSKEVCARYSTAIELIADIDAVLAASKPNAITRLARRATSLRLPQPKPQRQALAAYHGAGCMGALAYASMLAAVCYAFFR